MHGGLHGLFLQGATHGSDAQVNEAYDLVVIGGSLSGCFAAKYAAQQGMKVLLIERRTFLATEITATMRPWLQREGFAAFYRELKDLFLPDREQPEVGVPFDPENSSQSVSRNSSRHSPCAVTLRQNPAIRADGTGTVPATLNLRTRSQVFGDDVPLFMGTVKKQFMQAVLQNNVDVLIGTGVWGVLADEQRQVAAGLVLANKFGLHLVRCQRILDAHGQISAPTRQANRQVAYSLEFYGVDPASGPEVCVPKSLDLVDDKVFVHRGKRKPGQCFVEFRFVPTQEDVEQEARQRTETVCAYLVKEHVAFAKLHFRRSVCS